uniref:Glyoxalase/fosfomycin resistance/dioxygenase domain-containing protein n=1 Tax=Cannabis sativa TaxID=3483 RepID=A0A803R7C7_CANSA
MGSLGTEISEEYCINNDDLIIIEEEEEESCGSWSNNNGYNGVNNGKLPLLSLNHVSYVCKSVAKSVKFYEQVLGFVLIKRPSSFKFEGAWYVFSLLSLSLYIYIYLYKWFLFL